MSSSTKHQINHSAFPVSSSSSSVSHSQEMSQVTMEEVWKEINHHRQLNMDHEPMLRNQNPNNSIFQDFLSRPLNQEPPPFSSTLTALPPPAAVLSLNPHSTNFRFEESGCIGKKRSQDSDESRGERRYKRMIKNRESAARSRARKQAYTNELELEIAHLQKENARLKRQQEQLKMVQAKQHQINKTLQRSWTAPF